MITQIQLVIHLIESLHDNEVIRGSDKTEIMHNRNWHRYDSIQWVVVHGAIAYLTGNIFFLLTGLMIRFYCLQVVLNQLRRLPLDYLGASGIDGWCIKYLGKKVTFYTKCIFFAACFIYEYAIS